ncbi:MAG: spondin domain-containing protein [Acidobacteriota bacterium]
MTILRTTLAILLVLVALPAAALEVEVTVENVSPDAGTFLAPIWIGFHDGSFDSYDGGVSADGFPGLEQLAEDGNTAVLSDDFAARLPGFAQATLFGPAAPPLFPGESTSARFDLDPTQRYFSYASMILPSNDAFVANGNPLAHRVFDPNGNFTPVSFYVVGAEVNDAGTEVNDEIAANTPGLGQMAPNTGTAEGGVVTDHPGFLDGGNVLAARPDGDFLRPGYRIAKVTVAAVRTTTVHFPGSGDQEVPPVVTDASAACYATVSSDLGSLTVTCEHDVDNVTAAHVHAAEAGSNGDVIFPFADPASPISETFDLDAATLATLLDAGLYVNIHSEANPGGEVRAQIAGCFDGPTTLCLQDDQFQVAVEWQSADGAGVGRSLPATDIGGFFTFFSEDNTEVDVKILDGCDINGYYWVFAAGLTDVATELTVEHVASGAERTYGNDLGVPFELVRDLQAFLCE